MSATQLNSKVAIVTGAGRGMGRAAAFDLAAHGARVVVADITEDSGKDTVAAITDAGGEALFVRTDVADEADVRALVAETVSTYGGLDFGVNAAAIEIETSFLADSDTATFDRVIAVNLRSVYLCLKYEIGALLERGGGSIVNFASTNAERPQQTQSAYNASKAGVVGLTRTAAMEYARRGIRVNAIAPGAIDTPMLRDAIAARGADTEALLKKYGWFRRFGEPEEIARAVRWLCSDESSFTTGHTLAVDGGLLAG